MSRQTLQMVQAAPQALTMTDEINFANAVAQGSLLPQAYRNSPANVIIAVGLGQSMGLSPAESLYRINVIQGKPTASAELIAAQVRKAGHKLRISKDEERQSVTATIVRCDDPDYPISETRDAEWAKRMGLAGKDNYRKQPMTMLTWRAITACAREACPEALYGVAYTPDEMHDMDAAPQQVQSAAEPVAEPAAERTVESPAHNSGSYMQPVRERFRAWKAARGLTTDAAMAELCSRTKAESMATMNAAQAARAVDLMDTDLARDGEQAEPEPGEPAGGQEPDEGLYAEEVSW